MRLTPKIKELPVEGAEFRPKIVQPGPGAPRPAVDAASEPVIPRVGLDLYEAVYDAAAKNVSLRPRAEKLLPVLGSILIDAAALLAEADALFLEKVRDQHREARAAGVRQESVVADLEADLPSSNAKLKNWIHFAPAPDRLFRPHSKRKNICRRSRQMPKSETAKSGSRKPMPLKSALSPRTRKPRKITVTACCPRLRGRNKNAMP